MRIRLFVFFPSFKGVFLHKKKFCKVKEDHHGSFSCSNKEETGGLFKTWGETRYEEKRRKARRESRERLEEEERRKHHMWGEREGDSKVRGWECRGGGGDTQKGDPGEVSMRLSICPSSTCRPSCHCLPSSIHIINTARISSLQLLRICMSVIRMDARIKEEQRGMSARLHEGRVGINSSYMGHCVWTAGEKGFSMVKYEQKSVRVRSHDCTFAYPAVREGNISKTWHHFCFCCH